MLGNLSSNEKYSLTTLNLREQASTQSRILATMPLLSKMQVLDQDDEWINVRFEGKTGYVFKDYVSTTKMTTSNLNLRQQASIVAPSLAIIPKRTQVEVIDKNGDWSQVIYQDKKGYVYNTFLSDDGQKAEPQLLSQFFNHMTAYVNEVQIKSPSQFLLTTDLMNKQTYVFKRENKNWNLLYQWSCTVGKPSTPTITGTFHINGRKPSFGTNLYQVKYATRIKDGYYYHSILYNATGSTVIDDRLGEALSHGCIRLQTDHAQWIYRNIPDGTTVLIH